jgi:hypothetical protein
VRVSNELVRLYRKSHPEFCVEEEEAEREACGHVEDALYQAAVGGNVRACETWLYNRAPDRWRESNKDGAGGTRVTINWNEMYIRPPTVDPLQEAIAQLPPPANGQGATHANVVTNPQPPPGQPGAG